MTKWPSLDHLFKAEPLLFPTPNFSEKPAPVTLPRMAGAKVDEARDALEREVIALRAQVADLKRAAAGFRESEGVSLQEREELLHEAERIAHFGTWSWDIQSGRVTWSDEMYRILGLDPEVVTPSVERFFASVHPDDQARAQETTQKALVDGVLPLVDCRIVRPDGSIRETMTSGTYLFDDSGQPRRMVGGVLDRTESLATEAELRSTLALLEEAQHTAQLGSYRFDPKTKKLEWSAEFRRILGLSEDEPATPEAFFERLVPEDRPRFEAAYARGIEAPRGRPVEGRIRRPDGEIRHFRLKGALSAGSVNPGELRGTMLDITDQVRLREELAQSQKMEAVGRLAAGIAHDFNNLLTVVMGNLDALTEQIGTTAEIENSNQALESAASLTKRLLAYGRKAQLNLQYVDAKELVSSTISLLRRLVGDQVDLSTRLAPQSVHVLVDALEMERALVNLVVNAKNAMNDRGQIELGTRIHQEGETSQVEIYVADRGPGIPAEDLPHLFEPFFTTRGGSGGTGLGLATVLGTAEQHGGRVDVNERDGGGTIFSIILPAAKPDEVAERNQPELVAPAPDSKPLRVLVVDDEPMVADVTHRMLSFLGHSAKVANTVEDAERIWTEHFESIDLVLCDVVMPGMRGPDLVRRLEQLGKPPRALFMSGYNEESLSQQGTETVLIKPFRAQALHDAIQRIAF